MPGITQDTLNAFIPDLLRISREAGKAILEVYGSDFAIEHKGDNSPLTLADRRSHEVIAGGLASLQAGKLPVLSEEGKNIPYRERKGWELFWLVDPLDGTKEFIRRNGEFTVNIALIQKGRPVLGVIYLPTKNLEYFGAEGMGSYMLDRGNAPVADSLDAILNAAVRLPLAPHPSPLAPRITVIGSRSHMSAETEHFISRLRSQDSEIKFISAGSSLKFCLIAEGNADVYPRFAPTMEWDTAAGQAIVEQSGGSVLRADTLVPLSYNKENLLNPWFVAGRVPMVQASRKDRSSS
jgi:3'(2'), 5'-bisphosphate nucleotidase